jgi:hypothetical protein
MEQPVSLPTKRRRGNAHFGRAWSLSAGETEFEQEVARLGLSKVEYADSAELRRWCERNFNRCYVPEWLLHEWGMEVDAFFGRTG